MTIYVVVERDYDNGWVGGAYRTRDAAQEYIDVEKAKDAKRRAAHRLYLDYYIAEMDLK